MIKSRPDYFLCSDRQIIRQYSIRDPHHFTTNHKLVCGTLISNTLKENKAYLHGRSKFPHRTPKVGPSLRLESLCHDVEQAALPPLSIPEIRSKSWICETLWQIVDQKNALCRLPGPTNQVEYRRLSRSLKSSHKEDRKRSAATAGVLAEAELKHDPPPPLLRRHGTSSAAGLLKWKIDHSPSSREDLRKVTNDRITHIYKILTTWQDSYTSCSIWYWWCSSGAWRNVGWRMESHPSLPKLEQNT